MMILEKDPKVKEIKLFDGRVVEVPADMDPFKAAGIQERYRKWREQQK